MAISLNCLYTFGLVCDIIILSNIKEESVMSKLCYNYDSGQYEDIDESGYSYTQGTYVYNWDDSEYRREREEEEEEERRRREEDDW